MSSFGELASAASTLACGSGAGLFSTRGVAVGSASYVVIPPLAMLKMVTELFEYLAFSASTQAWILAPAPAGVDEPITTQLPGATSGAADCGAGASGAGASAVGNSAAGGWTAGGAAVGAGATRGSGACAPPPPPPHEVSRPSQTPAKPCKNRRDFRPGGLVTWPGRVARAAQAEIRSGMARRAC